MQKKYYWWYALAGMAVLLVGFITYNATNNSVVASQVGSGQAVIEPQSIDWGTISAAQGSVTKDFTIRNTGEGDLVVKKISTSCGCTTAQLVIDGEATRSFGMDHGNIPVIKEVIPAGESAILRVTFDPNFHYVRGRIDRAVYVVTSDKNNPEVTALSRLNVVD